MAIDSTQGHHLPTLKITKSNKNEESQPPDIKIRMVDQSPPKITVGPQLPPDNSQKTVYPTLIRNGSQRLIEVLPQGNGNGVPIPPSFQSNCIQMIAQVPAMVNPRLAEVGCQRLEQRSQT
jgi:hypothetical protein